MKSLNLVDEHDNSYLIHFNKTHYLINENLAIEITCITDSYEEPWTPYCHLTINTENELPNNQAFINTNSNEKLVDLVLHSDWCDIIDEDHNQPYPLVEFSEDFLNDVCTNY